MFICCFLCVASQLNYQEWSICSFPSLTNWQKSPLFQVSFRNPGFSYLDPFSFPDLKHFHDLYLKWPSEDFCLFVCCLFVFNEILNYFLASFVVYKFVVQNQGILDSVTADWIQPRPEDESTKCFWL